MDELNENDVERRLAASPDAGARVVLAEVDAPGSLHYLLEAEGFHVVGCASDERELGRVLGQGLDPDVIVLDADIAATSVLVARDHAPEAHVIAIWPDDVSPPPGGERVSPRLVYEDLGPMIRRHLDKRVVPVPDVVLPSVELAAIATGTGGSGAALGRAASRLSVTSVTLLTAILLTMGVSFALGGFRSGADRRPAKDRRAGDHPSRKAVRRRIRSPAELPGSTTAGTQQTAVPATGTGHHGGAGGQIALVAGTGGGDNTVGDPGAPVDQGGDQGTPVTKAGARATKAGVRATKAGARATKAGARATKAGARATKAGVRATKAGVRATKAGARATKAGARATKAGARATKAGARATKAATQETTVVRVTRTTRDKTTRATRAATRATRAHRTKAIKVPRAIRATRTRRPRFLRASAG